MILIEDVKSKYGTEIAMVLLCCRLHFNTEKLSILQHYIDTCEINWDEVIYLSKYHRIEPVVYKILSKSDLPAAIASRVKQSQFFLVQNNFKQALETERIIELLETRGIECTPYKGVAFSRQFYGDIISRESSDIDLIIDNKDFSRVLELMTADGYIFENKIEYSYYKEKIFTRNNSLNFDKFKGDAREFHIEFHWRITENFVKVHNDAHRQLFNNSDKIILAKREVNALNANAHYITLFIHHSNHDGFRVLKNIVDLCQIIPSNNNDIDIHYIKNAFKKLRLVKAAAVCCYLSSELLGLDLPLSPVNNNSLIPEKVKAFFMERLLGKRSYRDTALDNLDNRSQLYLKDSFSEKIAFIFAGFKQRTTPSPEDLQTLKLNRNLYFLYPAIKSFRLLTKGIDKKHIKQQK